MTCVISKSDVCDVIHFCQFHHCIAIIKFLTNLSFILNLVPGQLTSLCFTSLDNGNFEVENFRWTNK